MKVAVYGAGGLFAGAALTLFGILLAGFVDPRLRTAGEAAKTLGVPLYGALRMTDNPDELSEKGTRLWARWIGGSVGAPKARVVWSPALDVSENDFWTMMIAEARKLVPALIVVNCGADSPPAFASLPQSTDVSTENIVTTNFPIVGGSFAHVQELRELIDLWLAGGSEVWVRIAGPVQEPATTLARDLGAALLLVPLHRTESRYWKQQAELFRHSGTQPRGLIVLNEIPLSQADEKAN
jgi:hypothetical protein